MRAMNEPATRRSSFVPTEDLLPPPPLGRALMFGGLAALVGAAAWGLIVFFAHVEHGIIAWGIGALVGFAIVKAGGHGPLLAVSAGALALLSIGSGKHFAFQMFVDEAAKTVVAQIDASAHAERGKDAADWVALGEQPTPEQVRTFAFEHGYDRQDPQTFASEVGEHLRRFHAEKPTLEQMREQVVVEIVENTSFIEYLKDKFHPFDVVFVLLGIASAFGLVSRATQQLNMAALEKVLAEREADQKAAAPEKDVT